MGQLVDGKWQTAKLTSNAEGGKFKRQDSVFRNWVTADGSPGPAGEGGFRADPGRYHLYVSYACPWAHRALIFRHLKGLEEMIGVSVVDWFMGDHGWTFSNEHDPEVGDRLFGSDFLSEVYVKADPAYTGRVTVPVLWDKQQNTVVSNESADIIRMFNSAFDGVGAKDGDYYPAPLRAEIDEINARVYDTVNNGVYKSGFATSQQAYEEAVTALFDTLDFLEQRLSSSRYLAGDELTEADIRLFTTLVRFDAVYYGHFKCNLRRLADYPNLWAYAREIYQWPGVAETVRFDHIKNHYYQSHESVNPTRIVPLGPVVDWDESHGRGQIKTETRQLA